MSHASHPMQNLHKQLSLAGETCVVAPRDSLTINLSAIDDSGGGGVGDGDVPSSLVTGRRVFEPLCDQNDVDVSAADDLNDLSHGHRHHRSDAPPPSDQRQIGNLAAPPCREFNSDDEPSHHGGGVADRSNHRNSHHRVSHHGHDGLLPRHLIPGLPKSNSGRPHEDGHFHNHIVFSRVSRVSDSSVMIIPLTMPGIYLGWDTI